MAAPPPGEGGARPPRQLEDAGEAGQRCSHSRSSEAGRRRQCRPPGRSQAAGEIRPDPLAPGPLPDSPAVRAKSGRRWRRRGRRRILGSAIPRCPGWGETAAAHFLSNPAQRPTSLATRVNFNNFIRTQRTGRKSLPGGAGPARYWRLVGVQHALVLSPI